MRNFKKYLAFVLTIAMLVTAMAPVAFAGSEDYATEARNLYDLGLFRGLSDEVYDPGLENNLTRQEAAVLILRMFGLEEDALEMSAFEANSILRTKFADAEHVAPWAAKQVAYATEQGVIAGRGDVFDPLTEITGREYATLTLGQLGYEVEDFNKAGEQYAQVAGLSLTQEIEFGIHEPITRGTVVGISYTSLEAPKADGSGTLAERLVATGIVDAQAVEGFGIYAPPSEPVEPAEPELAVHDVVVETEGRTTTVEATVVEFEEGHTATLTLTPDAELELEDIVVEDLEISEDGLVSYTFESRLPAGAHVVTVCVEDACSMPVMFEIEVPEYADVEEVRIASPRTFEVEFTRDLSDEELDELTFEVKRGLVTVNITEVTFNEENDVATLHLAARFREADYEVTVRGLDDFEYSEVIEAGEEEIAEIVIVNEIASARDGMLEATVNYKVYNQYREDVTEDRIANSITWTSSRGDAEDDSEGTLTLTYDGEFEEGQIVTITGVDSDSGTVVTEIIEIGDVARVDEITLIGLWTEEDETLHTGVSDYRDYYILMEAYDQYGNLVEDADQVNEDVIFTTSNDSIVDLVRDRDGDNFEPVVEDMGDEDDQLAIQLANIFDDDRNDGTAVIRAISRSTGFMATIVVEVEKAGEVEEIILSLPEEIVAVGETVEIPFVAYDQYDLEITRASDLRDQVTLSPDDRFEFTTDYARGRAILEFTPERDRDYILQAIADNSGKSSRITVRVEEEKEADLVTGVGRITLIEDATYELEAEDITIMDQYDREYDIDDFFRADYTLKVENEDHEDGYVLVEGGEYYELTHKDDSVVFTAVEEGRSNIIITIYKDGEEVEGSELEFEIRVVDQSAAETFEIGSVDALYNTVVDDYAVEFMVYGFQANGNRVELPITMFSVEIDDRKVEYCEDEKELKLNATFHEDDFDDDDLLTVEVKVLVDAEDGLVELVTEVVVSNEAPKLTTITIEELDEDEGRIIEVDNDTALLPLNRSLDTLIEIFEGEDQYGVEFDLAANEPRYFVSGIRDDDDERVSASEYIVGNGTVNAEFARTPRLEESFTLTVTVDGRSKSVSVAIVDPDDGSIDIPVPDPGDDDDDDDDGDELEATYVQGLSAFGNTALVITLSEEVAEDDITEVAVDGHVAHKEVVDGTTVNVITAQSTIQNVTITIDSEVIQVNEEE